MKAVVNKTSPGIIFPLSMKLEKSVVYRSTLVLIKDHLVARH